MTAICLTIPYPPSANRLWRNVPGKGTLKSALYRAWQTAAAVSIRQQTREKIAGPYCLSLEAERPDRRRRDLGNLLKATEDCLVDCGVITDDSLSERIVMEWSAKAPAKPGALNIIIRPYAAAPVQQVAA
jgi:crossover junction endodeoxyribonuclease RusA